MRGVETVIVDEVHAVAGTKRGAHLALSLERLDELLDRPAQRVGLSATVRPVEEVATFLCVPVCVVQPAADKTVELDVVVPVEDCRSWARRPVNSPAPRRAPSSAARSGRTWKERIVDLVTSHRSIVFANSRRLAERLTARLNEVAWERETEDRLPAAGR